VAITVVNSAGHAVAMHRLDNTQLGSLAVAEDKARTSVFYRRPSKAFEDAIASGGIGLRVLGLRGATPYEGGVPLFVDGKLIGAVGVSSRAAAERHKPQLAKRFRAHADAIAAHQLASISTR
jgi:glc operon protein GlcG